MRLMMRWVMLVAVSVLVAARQTDAEPIIYTETVTGSGTLDGLSYTNRLVTFTETADTASITEQMGMFLTVPALIATVQVAGIVADTFTRPKSLSLDVYGNLVLVDSSNGSGLGIVGEKFPDLLGYNLSTSIGPVTGSDGLLFSGTGSFATVGGSFKPSSYSSDLTFQAVGPFAVPEPSSLVLCGIAGVAGLGYRWFRRRAIA